ncbi:MAG: adenylate/guanylate cyclase domain-containing protein [Candidatus Binatia bacterium]
MTFDEILAQVRELLEREGRVAYRILKRRFELNDEDIEDLKADLIDAKRLATDEDGKVLVWVGKGINGEKDKRINRESEGKAAKRGKGEKERDFAPRTPHSELSTAERRQLTVMFCDLVGSTALSAQLDPEDYRAVVQAYQETCAAVIQRHDGYMAQYLGDGLLVYFGYPTAHEDDAQRAVRAGLEIIANLQKQVSSPLVGVPPFSRSPFQEEGSTSSASAGEGSVISQSQNTPHPNPPSTVLRTGLPQGERGLAVRIGIHTGLVVIGEIGSSEKRELLALGETPNIAARIQGLADPNTVIVSAATYRLIEGYFESQPFGSHLVKGIDTPIAVYHVQSERQNISPLAGKTTLTPLVGREQEVGLLIDRWEQTKDGRGQVVLLSGEPGIGKSRLAYTLRERITAEGSLLFEARCSPYHQNSAFYPLIDVLQRTSLLSRQDTDDEKVTKLERALELYNLQESLLLFTALLSLPTPSQYPPLNLTPQKQKERTLQALVQLLAAQAERQATVSVWEDLHWADPSSLEFLTLLIEQIPTTKLLLVLTFRPEFRPPWNPRSHISQLVLNRLGKKQVETMIEKAATGTPLPPEVIEQIRVKTDGVPLFVEEVTKSIIEARGQGPGDGEQQEKSMGGVGIPATLQEALLARLDRLSEARQVAQLGATLGREFSYELLHAVAPINETDLEAALNKLVEAEILYQRGIGAQARYFFKHALIQDTAYQSLLKSTRQQYHQQIAHVLEDRFSDIKANQPELLAHHYTEANFIEQAIPYWKQAGQRATQRSAYVEAINYLTKGLEALKTLPNTPERAQQDLTLQLALGEPLIATKGFGALEVEQTYTRAQELCQQLGETPQLALVLEGLSLFYMTRAEYKTTYKLRSQCLTLAQRVQDPGPLLRAHQELGGCLLMLGEFVSALEHFDRAIALHNPQHHFLLTFRKVYSQNLGAWAQLALGYADQALTRNNEALLLARELPSPFERAYALFHTAIFHLYRRDGLIAQKLSEQAIALASDAGLSMILAWATITRGWALAEQGKGEEGLAQMRQGLAALRATGAELSRPTWLGAMAEACGKVGQVEEGLSLLAEALAAVDKTEECLSQVELYRLRGELTLQQQSKVQSLKSKVTDPRPLNPDPQGEAEACFLKAIDIARQQQAKSWELRASTSLARLWQSQGKRAEAYKLLSDVYNWFTEGFDTKDLREAKALLEELAEG